MTVRTFPLPADFFGTATRAGEEAKVKRAIAAQDRGLEPCEACGRGVAAGSGWVITITDGGCAVLHPDDDGPEAEADGGYMGSYVWGPECGRKVPAEFRTRWNGWS